MTFPDFMRARFGANWALCRATAGNRARYGRCISRKEYARAEADWRRENPEEWFHHTYGPDSVPLHLYLALLEIEANLTGRDCFPERVADSLRRAKEAIAEAKGTTS